MKVVIHGSELSAATAAAALSWVGHDVCWQPLDRRWSELKDSDWLIREPSVLQRLTEAMEAGHLTLERNSEVDGPDIDVLWLALSPTQRDDASRLVEENASCLADGAIIVNNATFPVGDTERLESVLEGQNVTSVALPDTLEEGRAWETFTRARSWLLGCDDDHAERQVRELMRAFNRRHEVFKRMPRRAAELTKLAINGMLATRISYMNEMAGLADTLGVDVEYVRQGMGADQRIGYEYLYPGCGFGGPNFSRDLVGLVDVQSASGRHSELLDQVLEINEHKKETLFRKLWAHYQGRLEGRTVAIWGAAFKPGTARIDHAPVLTLLRALWAQGVHVRLHDPAALPAVRAVVGDHPLLSLHQDDPLDACHGADALMLVTEWKAYWNPDWMALKRQLEGALILDGRNIYDPQYVAAQGFHYRGIGRRADPAT
ncbi:MULTISPECIES: nucleotide sugar dehydrogenase [unclassified Halomonas]|uniref:nucleotide sugar dehydrogenase n=1 Tax=unclassified Halomonas TaxID=2609666 RepID=UPI0005FA2478|nr:MULTISPECIES: nucleotide sugar dehydrogenase [unclassified Halomonas]KJZ16817.1 UDP-glucose 6-dehydrogenase [Halomonas sp. S2151]MCJ8286071.1 nucleotide sugar dehydrogenase [Halomonas sp.]MCO7215969.1 nucleotide sugar dehydrogenase [Halomonas sp. OfavH-34-E]NQY71123.1 UDP-glucose/GDP-mannose dehydrogenase family protein [Halomonas sp.]RQW70000.1 UDP-glucose/GDP-mannose dehydrogenase family protein [Halomonas sp. YLB-10]